MEVCDLRSNFVPCKFYLEILCKKKNSFEICDLFQVIEEAEPVIQMIKRKLGQLKSFLSVMNGESTISFIVSNQNNNKRIQSIAICDKQMTEQRRFIRSFVRPWQTFYTQKNTQKKAHIRHPLQTRIGTCPRKRVIHL